MKKVCAWCGNTIEEGDPSLPVTHGMCPPCEKRERVKAGLKPREGPEICPVHNVPLVFYRTGLDRYKACPGCLPRQDDRSGQEDYEAVRAHPLNRALLPSEFWP
jgi:hypothetical protein